MLFQATLPLLRGTSCFTYPFIFYKTTGPFLGLNFFLLFDKISLKVYLHHIYYNHNCTQKCCNLEGIQ